MFRGKCITEPTFDDQTTDGDDQFSGRMRAASDPPLLVAGLPARRIRNPFMGRESLRFRGQSTWIHASQGTSPALPLTGKDGKG